MLKIIMIRKILLYMQEGEKFHKIGTRKKLLIKII